MSLIIAYHHKSLGVVCTDDRMSVEDPTTGEMKIVAGREAKILQLPGGTVLGSVGRAIVGEQLRADVLRTMEHDRLAFGDLVRLVPEVAARHFEARTRLANPKKDLLDVLLVGFDEQQHRIRGYIWRSETGFEEIETTKDPGARIAAAGAFTDAKILQALTKHAGLAKWRKAPWYAGLLRDAINEHADRNPLGTIGRASFFAGVDRDGAVTLPEEFPPAPAPEMQLAAVDAVCNEGGFIYVGSILTPPAGGTDTVGNGDGGGGAQVGNLTTLGMAVLTTKTLATPASVTSPQLAVDGNTSTACVLSATGAGGGGGLALVALTGVAGVSRNYYSASLFLIASIPTNTLNSSLLPGAAIATFQYSIDGGHTLLSFPSGIAALPGTTYPVTTGQVILPFGLNLSQVQLFIEVNGSTSTAGTADLNVYEAYIQAEE